MKKPKNPDAVALGRRLQRARESKEWSRAVLAEKAELTDGAIKMIESGHRYPQPSTLAAIVKALGISKGSLVDDLPVSPPEPIAGFDIVKRAVKEALAEGPLPQKFEHPEVLERLRQENADLKKRVRDLENHLKVFESMFDEVPTETLQAFLMELPEQKRFAWREALSALNHDAQKAPDVLRSVLQILEDRQQTGSLKSPKRGK